MTKQEAQTIAREIADNKGVSFMQVEQFAEPNTWKVTFSDDDGTLRVAHFTASDGSPSAFRRNGLQLAFGTVE